MAQGQVMRVLHLVKTSTGATWAFRQMRELAKLGVEIHVALPDDGPLVSQYKEAGITVHPYQFDFPIKQLWRFPQIAGQFRHLVDQVKPDIIHSHFVGTTLTMRLALGRRNPIPRVFQVPGPLHLEHAFFRRMELVTASSQDRWIGSCQWTCDRYRQSGIAPERLFLSYYGIDLDKLTAHPSGKLRRELGISADMPLVGMVAFMYAPKRYLGQKRGLKGHEDLIDALALCLRKTPFITGVFIGGAWSRKMAHYEAQIRAYGRKRCGNHAIFLGTRQDVAELYPDLDVVVHPSHSENVGGAAESLSIGIPTITTTVGGFPDLIQHGVTGWMVPPQAPDQLANTIQQVLADRAHAHEIAVNGQQLARRLFDINHTSKQILEIYGCILA